MMKLMNRLAASAAGAGLVLAAVAHLEEGEPADPPSAGTAARDHTVVVDATSPSTSPSTAVPGRGLYRWRDQAGVINISTESDLAPGYAERFALPAVVFATHRVENGNGQEPPGLIGLLESSPISIYSYEGLTTLMSDTGRIAERLRSRNQLLEKLAGQL